MPDQELMFINISPVFCFLLLKKAFHPPNCLSLGVKFTLCPEDGQGGTYFNSAVLQSVCADGVTKLTRDSPGHRVLSHWHQPEPQADIY